MVAREPLTATLLQISYVFNAWVPNLVFPASKAPHYPVGYKVTTAFFAIFSLGSLVAAYLERRYVARKAIGNAEASKAEAEQERSATRSELDEADEYEKK